MTSADLVRKLISDGLSKYAIAKSIGAFPTSVDHWLAGAKMSDKYREQVNIVWGIKVDDSV